VLEVRSVSPSTSTRRFAYADPPYPGQAKKHYEDHPDYAGEVDHPALIERLTAEFPDGWALSTNPGELHWLLPLCPKHRVLAWLKPFAAWKRNHWPAYAWEPVILVGGRSCYGTQETPRDFIVTPYDDDVDLGGPPDVIAESITMKKGVSGAKPLAFCLWLFQCLGAQPGDELVDLYPGSRSVSDAWATYCAQQPLAFPAEPENVPMFDELPEVA
jgi:hypothetical protein